MRIYFSGVGGVGIGPLARVARDAGYDVVGSDATASLMTEELQAIGIQVSLDQSGDFLRREHETAPFDWFVHTAALPSNHPELQLAQELGIRTSKRDEVLAHIIAERNLKLIAIAGTHGKTTTTGMLVWLAKYFGIPISYCLGTTLSWWPSGAYTQESEYFVYECDEFDRNFLAFYPYLSVITTIEHDHPDTYPTSEEYFDAFRQFAEQSSHVVSWKQYEAFLPSSTHLINEVSPFLTLPGLHNRQNASLLLAGLELFGLPAKFAADGLNKFPGTQRRFEQLAPNLYTDYGHTPSEIKATLQMAKELSDHVTLVYQPHQNRRQHEIRDAYTNDIFEDADETIWLPTYLSREDESLEVLTPETLSRQLSHVTVSTLDDELWLRITQLREDNQLVLCMGAGDIDTWLRHKLLENSVK